jgi:hypothetical protein
VENPVIFHGKIQGHLSRVEKQFVTEFFSDERMPLSMADPAWSGSFVPNDCHPISVSPSLILDSALKI